MNQSLHRQRVIKAIVDLCVWAVEKQAKEAAKAVEQKTDEGGNQCGGTCKQGVSYE